MDWMDRARELALRGPAADPNPRVGCVIVHDDVPVGEGWHLGAGTDHAEVMALRAAGHLARGATAWVTLEPCHHTGRTGPCVEALLAAGIAEVHYGAADPHAPAAGGADALRAAGVRAHRTGDTTDVNREWLFSARHGRPFVRWKFAASLDGRSAAADGSSQWITSPEARADVHRMRADHQAVLVGTGTAIADDPQLTARDTAGVLMGRQPLRVVMGRRALAPSLRLFDDAAETLHLTTRDPHEALAALAARDIHSVWLEGGPTLAAAFWRSGLVDEVVAHLAPLFLGTGTGAVADLGITTLSEAERLTITDCTRIGPDVRITLIRKDTDVHRNH